MASGASDTAVVGAACSRVDISVLAGGPRLRSEREHVSRGVGDEGDAHAVAARRVPSGFAEWHGSADLHHWQQGCRSLRWHPSLMRSPGKQALTIGLNVSNVAT